MHDLYSTFHAYIRAKNLFLPDDKLLLGVSGGADSVVLLDLVEQLGNEYAIAHCNFNLRSSESDAEEQFVQILAEKYGVPFRSTSFETNEIAEERGVSIEMAARDLRYQWFENVRVELNYDYIVVAHHLDDVLETFILNLSRGTGIRGLSGIKDKAGKIIRPLLFAKREEIESYALTNKLDWRTDSSNADTNYKRNKVRHEVLPLLEQLNPSFRKNLSRTISNLNETEQVFLTQIEEAKKKVLIDQEELVRISIKTLKELTPLTTYLYEFLRPYNFNTKVLLEIIDNLDAVSGSQFYSSSHRLVHNRDELLITPLKEEPEQLFYIEKMEEWVDDPIRMRLKLERLSEDFVIPRDQSIAVFDYDKVVFPLIIRKWRQGEYFMPLGMKSFKKLSDFFIDEKYSIPEKEQAWILYSGKEVVWIVGKRIDNRFKITPQTKLVLRIELK